jgi:hypothetical protein
MSSPGARILCAANVDALPPLPPPVLMDEMCPACDLRKEVMQGVTIMIAGIDLKKMIMFFVQIFPLKNP